MDKDFSTDILPIKPPILVARIPNDKRGIATLKHLRECVNREGYRMRVRFSGPRERGAYNTKRVDAEVFRVYLDSFREREEMLRRYDAENKVRHLLQELDIVQTQLGECTTQLNQIPKWVLWCVSFVRRLVLGIF